VQAERLRERIQARRHDAAPAQRRAGPRARR
jgi:hypothetical protein